MSSRFDYVKYDDRAAEQQMLFKRIFLGVESAVEDLPNGRAKALVLTKLEEAYMWVGKAIRDDQIARSAEAQLQEERGNS